MKLEELAADLKELRRRRKQTAKSGREKRPARKPLTNSERDQVFRKTNGRCHICGGDIDGKWQADHIFAHSAGGKHHVDNYLPAHAICNNYRWHYGSKEFQWILKIGVFAKTEIEKLTNAGETIGRAFVRKENSRLRRTQPKSTK